MMMLDKGFSSPRRDAFPAGLRVLVVDDDPTWLKILEKMLKRCHYQVTTCGLAIEALSLLRERKDGYDIVISDVNMPDMDGFKLLEYVGLEMDLPVIMMSVDGETSRVMKGVQHGACDYLLKPIRMKELRNIWQHVIRKKLNEVRDIESIESVEVIRMTRNGADYFDDGHMLGGDELNNSRKRKDHESKHDENELSDSSTMKKARVVWNVDLHQKFVDAVNQIGFDKVGPKKILELMSVPWLTRENVASHLQKYRQYLDRLQKENGQKTSIGDPSGNFSNQKLVDIHQGDVFNEAIIYSNNNVNIHNTDPPRQEDDIKGSVPIPTKEPNRALIVSVSDPQALMTDFSGPCKETSMPRDFDTTFASLESEVNYSLLDSVLPTHYTWSDVKDIRFEQASKPLILPNNGFNQLPLSCPQHQIQVELPRAAVSISSTPSITVGEVPGANENQPLYGPQHQNDVPPAGLLSSSVPSTTKTEVSGALKNQPLYAEQEGNHVSPTEIAKDSFHMLSKNHITSYSSVNPVSPAMLDMKNQGFSLNSFPVFEPEENNVVYGPELPVALQEELKLCWHPNDYSAMGFGLENIEFSWYNDPGPMAELPINYCDALRSDCEYPAEYSMIGQGLFA